MPGREPDGTPTRPRPVGVGVAGLGRIGTRHAENLAGRIPGGRLARVMDVRDDVAAALAARLAVPACVSYNELLEADDVEAVVVCTPAPAHEEMVVLAAAAGRHVFCEKPLALGVESARRANEAARAAGVILQVGFQTRFDPDFAALAPRVHAGELGALQLLTARLRDMRPPPREYLRTSAGLVADGTVHLLDLARWLAGPITEVRAFAGAVADPAIAELDDVEHLVTVLRFASGALGVLENSRSAGYGFECSAELVGSRRTVRVSQHRRLNLEWRSPGTVAVDHTRDFLDRFEAAYRVELENFVDAIERDGAPVVTGTDAVIATALATAVNRSWREDRSVDVRELGDVVELQPG